MLRLIGRFALPAVLIIGVLVLLGVSAFWSLLTLVFWPLLGVIATASLLLAAAQQRGVARYLVGGLGVVGAGLLALGVVTQASDEANGA